ncbi:hypothetical protein GJ744_000482 [Endocarpon pusillum]|uniref:Uncharacterized protein n=1 Tax=Endocarpon pusillum TaxID=364733 RepID=A0A8H7AEM5_9EURO|nr:hypothetical protein GJ744_000482 [Endocarpon pusillum]
MKPFNSNISTVGSAVPTYCFGICLEWSANAPHVRELIFDDIRYLNYKYNTLSIPSKRGARVYLAFAGCPTAPPQTPIATVQNLSQTIRLSTCAMSLLPTRERHVKWCSQAGHITVFVSPSASGKASMGGRDEYYILDVYAEFEAQLIAALNSPLPPAASPTVADDKALIEALKDATSFVKVEHEDAEEQFDEDGAPTADSHSDEDSDKCLDRSQSQVKLGTGFGLALGRLLFSS